MDWLTAPWSWKSPADVALAASVPALVWAGVYCLYRAGLIVLFDAGTGKHRAG